MVQILFEDETILVLDKPAGLVVNRAETTASIKTLQDWLIDYFKNKGLGIGGRAGPPAERAGIVHRLDKETSGILVVAKTIFAFKNLQKQFQQREVEKKYLALVHGKVEPPEGLIKAPISRNPFNRKKFGVFLGGRPAETKYQVLKYLRQPESKIKRFRDFSLLELSPKTGRTHQIRVHLKHLGYSVVADQYYAGRKTNQRDRQWCPRQFLHASFLRFRHPETQKEMEFVSELPADLKKALQYLT